jgi:aminoglycoside phosphotransferase (APT) family kinase protein
MKMEKGIQVGLERTASLLPDSIRTMSAAEVESVHWTNFIGTMSSGPQTLLHGDAHIGNTYVLPDDGVGFLDWQVLRRGHPSLDLGYFLQGAISVADRRTHEADIVESYRLALDVPEETRPTRDELWLRYRASAAHGLALWLATSASDTWQRPENSFALAERYGAAFDDLRSIEAISALAEEETTTASG